MARGLGRSKGCRNCLQRKIKCDEKIPSCTQCTRGGRQCSGALSTVFLIVESETVNTNPTYKPRHTEPNFLGPHDNEVNAIAHRPKGNYQASGKTLRRISQATRSWHYQRVLPPTVKSVPAIANQFLSQFISFYARTSPRKVLFDDWMKILPNMLAENPISTGNPIAAASMVYVGRDSGNTSIVVESYKWYGVAIAGQQRLLQELQHEKRVPTVEEICTPILLSFYEVICNTSPMGYFQHLMGAARLLEMRGPKDCSSGILHAIFSTLRIQLIHPAIVARVPSIFATEEWLTIPFQGGPKSVFERVTDALTILSSILCRLNQIRSTGDFSDSTSQRMTLKVEAEKIKGQLDLWWEELREESRIFGWIGEYHQGVPGFDFDYDDPNSDVQSASNVAVQHMEQCSGNEQLATPPPTKLLNNCYGGARATCYYNIARILTLSILKELDAAPTLFSEQIRAHSESILSIATVLTGMDIGYAFVRVVFPLTVVSRLSLLDAQKAKAKEILFNWKVKAGVAGLCEVVLSDLEGEAFWEQR